jgi:ABC-type branched-subunit amino acid transport system permease subunit
MKKKLVTAGALLAIAFGGAFGVNAVAAGPGQGHTPVVVCHWVPAALGGAHSIEGPDGGSFVVIVVDDDGSTGNGPQKAHFHHDHDLFGDTSCDSEDDD